MNGTAPPAGHRLAIVDDRQHFYAALLAEHLAAAGHTVAHRVERAEDLPADPGLDAVMCDLRLERHPGATGADAVALLAAAGHRVLVTTAHAGDQEVLDTLAAGAAGYLSKDRGPAEHVAALAGVAAGGVHVGPELATVLVADARCWPLPSGDLTRRELSVLRSVARGETPRERAAAGHAPEDVEAVAVRALEVARRRRTVARLPQRARQVVELVGGQRLSRGEVAAALHITDDTLGQHLDRIRRHYERLRPQHAGIRPMAAAEALYHLLGLDPRAPAGVPPAGGDRSGPGAHPGGPGWPGTGGRS